MTCVAVGERNQMIIVWMRALGIGNTSHPQRQRVTKIRPSIMHNLLRETYEMVKITLMGGVS
jgi:hypothetical protein